LDLDARNIAEVVDSSLYRQRAGRDEKTDTAAASGEKEDQKMVMERLRSLGYL
jgi:hypothetical protein